MHLGLFCLMPQRDRNKPARQIYAEMVEQVRCAEQAGFEIAWFAEHHFSNYCLCPSPITMATYMAPQTSRIRLGTAVVVAPLYEPMRMLEDLVVLDNLSDGRLVLGVGSGYQHYEFHRFGRDLTVSQPVTLEMLELMERAFTSQPFSYDGEHVKVPETYFAVQPPQGMPDVYVAGMVDNLAMQTRMAKCGYVPFVTTGWSTLDEIAASKEKVAEGCKAAGVDARNMPFALQQYIHVTDDHDEALDAADHARYVRRVATAMREQYAVLEGSFLLEAPARGEPPLEVIARNALIGSAEKIAEQLVAELRRLGPTHLSCFFAFGGLDQARVLRSIERFTEEVVPLVEKAVGPLANVGVPVPEQRPLAAAE